MWTLRGLKKAIECFEQALLKDPNYALAYVGIASVWFYRAWFGNFPPKKVIPKAKTYIKKALDIDEYLAEAHALLGNIITMYDWKWELADQEFKQALELNQNSSIIHFYYCNFLSIIEHHEESVIEVKRARELDPLNINISANVGERLYFARQFDNAIEDLQKTIEMDKNWWYSYLLLGNVYLSKKMFKESIVELEKASNLSGGIPITIVLLAIVYYRIGRKADVEKLFKKLEEMAKEEYIPASFFFIFYKFQGNTELAFKWLEKACEDRDIYLPYHLILIEDYLRIPYDKKSTELLKKVGLVKKGT
jgi:tetratricopeptide (TPR) repeat protein